MLSRDGATVYAVDQIANEIVTVDTATESIVTQLPAGDSPSAVTLSQRRDPSCAGRCRADCNGDCRVSIDELITIVGIATGMQPVQTCFALDSLRRRRPDPCGLHQPLRVRIATRQRVRRPTCSALLGSATTVCVRCGVSVTSAARIRNARRRCVIFDLICCDRHCDPVREYCGADGTCRMLPGLATSR